MTAIAAIAINDGLTVPQLRTFEPVDVTGRAIVYQAIDHENAHTLSGRPQITMTNRPLSNGSGNYKATLRVRVPVLEEGFTEPESSHKVLFTVTANFDMVIPAAASSGEINDAFAYIVNALSDAQVISTFKNTVLPY